MVTPFLPAVLNYVLGDMIIEQIAEKSIAVLPFMNMSDDPENEYFSDGITEEIINALTKINGLKVIARTSAFAFKNKHEDIRTIARLLGVRTVLEGSVRKAADTVRITAQLIRADDGTHLWSEKFDRQLADIFAVQDEISLLIADQIRENYGHFDIQDHLVRQSTTSVTAYDLFLKGRYHQLKWTPDSIRAAIGFYESAIAQDARFARAYYGNVQSYGLLAAWGYMPAEEGFAKAIDNFMIAQDLDSQLPEYAQSFVGKSFWGDWDFQLTHERTLQALELNPHYTDAIEALTELYIATGHFDRAEEEIQKALSIDPFSANHQYTLANINYMQKKYAAALELLDKSLSINPEFHLAHALRLMCLAGLGKRAEFEQAVAGQEDPAVPSLLFEVLHGGVKTLPAETLSQWAGVAEDKNQLIPWELYVLANSDHRDEALQLLTQYVAQKRGQVINFRVEPLLEALREMPGFDQLHTSNLELATDQPAEAARPVDSSENRVELERQQQKLLQHISENKPYLNPQLTLSGLAGEVELHANRVSLLINKMTGRNFNDFINHYRLEEFKAKVHDVQFSHLSILGIAYESGFNSKTVFNAYFKKVMGITPTEWRKTVR
jgi:adenylate cyclase